MARALDVARYMIHLNNRVNAPQTSLTNLKIQKLLYYAFGMHRVMTNGENLFNENVSAWKYGPVIKEVYDAFKKYGYSDIEDDYWYEDFNLTPREINTIENTWDQLGQLPANVLVEMTHRETPWIEAWNNYNKEINPNIIEEYFRQNYVAAV
ncbi:putative phage-associated protein [Neobacillus niacini]|uniref:Panacea domain-containing protein n=1 Tax=Neobacillus niacini TaxID=86668 RepID=UPI002789508E|nr:type II toxin-antitoxin system antitoxin SocA domain-containing protein [Neobacillus niacini]MDQ0999777.1 putative phage-associated protein [Neobacillus niacini]